MSGTTRRQALDVQRAQRDPAPPRRPHAAIWPRSIDVAWASIGRDDVLPGELVFNRADSTLVYRKGDDTLYKWANDGTRSI